MLVTSRMINMLKGILKGIRGQFTADVGNIVAPLVVIAIGALVFYSVTGAIETESGSHLDNVIANIEQTSRITFILMTILASAGFGIWFKSNYCRTEMRSRPRKLPKSALGRPQKK